MQKVKPDLPPKPNSGNASIWLNNSHVTELKSGLTANSVLTDCSLKVPDNSAVETFSVENINNLKVEAQRSPKQGPRTAPKPKPKCEVNTEVNSSFSNTSKQLGTGTVLLAPAPSVAKCDEESCKFDSSSALILLVQNCGLSVESGKSANQRNNFPIKPPRPNRNKKLSFTAQNDSCTSSEKAVSGIQSSKLKENGNAEVLEQDRPKSSKNRLLVNLPKNNVSAEEGINSPSSADSSRIYRSPSYEKALEDDILQLPIHSVNSAECSSEIYPTASSDKNADSLKTSNTPENSRNICLGSNQTVSLQVTRIAPPPPAKPKALLLIDAVNSNNNATLSDTAAAAAAEAQHYTNSNPDGYIYPTVSSLVNEELSGKKFVGLNHKKNPFGVRRSSSDSAKKLPMTQKSNQKKGKLLKNPSDLSKKEKSTDCDSALIPLLGVHG